MTHCEATAKRTLDLLASIIGIILLSPVLAALALAILLREGRPILFSECRVGQQQRPFTIYKFRSLDLADTPLSVVTSEDIRLTPTGQWLRRRHLDELPQLFNILIGDMSLVGPRPMKLEHASAFPEKTRCLLVSVKPGLTGPDAMLFLAEDEALSGYAEPETLYLRCILPAKAACITDYIRNYSLLLDLKIILQTARNVFSASAYSASRKAIRALFLTSH